MPADVASPSPFSSSENGSGWRPKAVASKTASPKDFGSLVVTPMMVLVSRLGWGGDVFEEYASFPLLPPTTYAHFPLHSPVFVVSSMLLIASPPALTLRVAQVHPFPSFFPYQRANATKTTYPGTGTGTKTTAEADPNAFSPSSPGSSCVPTSSSHRPSRSRAS